MSHRFQKRSLLGSGTFGKVFLVACKDNNEQYAMKEIRVSGLSKKDVDQVMTEVSVLAYSKHVNIIRYKSAFMERGLLNIVMEYADDGDLHQKIQEQKRIDQNLPEEVILDWFVQICSGIGYLHGKNILHRDLKTQNIFLTKSRTVKIGDFGISKILEHTADQAQTAVGTPYFLSPEICQRQPYNQKTDMWSIGCVLYELACLRYPFEGANFQQLVVAILHGKFKPLPEHYSILLKDLVAVLLTSKADHRPTADKILCIPGLRGYLDAYIRHLQTCLPASPKPVLNSPIQKENIDSRPVPEPVTKVRKHSLITPRTRQPLKEKRCYSNEENIIRPEPSKKAKFSTKPTPTASLYKKAIAQQRRKSKFSPKLQQKKTENVDSTTTSEDVEMNEVFDKPENDKNDINSKTFTIPSVSTMKYLYDSGITDKNKLVTASEGLKYHLEQKMGCDKFFRLYLAMKDSLTTKRDYDKFENCVKEAEDLWPVLYHFVQLNCLSQTIR